MNIAEASALRSEDQHCQVGACILDESGIVIGVGYNGTIAGVAIDWADREARRPFVLHAEANALRYVTPWIARGGLMACTHYPCAPCVLLARSYGISRVVWQTAPDWDRYPAEGSQHIARTTGLDLSWLP
jgi:dCMP deaminase